MTAPRTFTPADHVIPADPPPPEPVVVEPPVIVDADPVPGTEVAVPRTAYVAENWAHDFLEFKGDKLGIRIPKPQAMGALSMALSRFTKRSLQSDFTNLFIAQHISEDSYAHIFTRLMDPDDPDYTPDTIGEIVEELLNIGMAAMKDDEPQAHSNK